MKEATTVCPRCGGSTGKFGIPCSCPKRVCKSCTHPEVVHGGWARPDMACAYRDCSCRAYVAHPEAGAEL